MTSPHELDDRFRAALDDLTRGAPRDPTQPAPPGDARLRPTLAWHLVDAQFTSRHLDLAARWLHGFGEGYYTIGSAGHEGNAALAGALRPTDPALPHYRSLAFYCARAAQVPGTDPVRDVLRGLVASAREPMAGGRHKVIGHPDLAVLPTTGAAAAHLPRAVGIAFAMGRAGRLGVPVRWPQDAIVYCSFGDAAVNHALAGAALNTAGWCVRAGLPLPLLLVCEDNGIGLTVTPPAGWTETALRSRPGLRYYSADGTDLAATFEAADAAVRWVRRHRRPAILHLSMVRLMGHSGDDSERVYRPAVELAEAARRDPLVTSARLLVEAGVATPDEVLARYEEIGWQVRQAAEEVLEEPKLADAAEVVAPLAPRRPVRVARAVASAGQTALAGPPASPAPDPPTPGAVGAPRDGLGRLDQPGHGQPAAPAAGATPDRWTAFTGRLPEERGPLSLAESVHAALVDALVSWPQALVFGRDVAARGGPHGVTRGLRDRFGAGRVFDTLLDETSLLGLALGAGLSGLLPVPEIQRLAHLHSAGDQLRGEAATMGFLSQGAYRGPMVIRIAGLAYQGTGGHRHNDNGLAALRDIPGLVVACPARPDDAAAMLRTCLSSALSDGTVCAFLEPAALYHVRDLYAEGDAGWLAGYPPPGEWGVAHVPVGRARVDVLGNGADLTIVTFGNGVRMSLRVAAGLAALGVGVRVVDLRWLAPLPAADIVTHATATGRVLIVDETRRSGGVGEGVLSVLADRGYVGAALRVAALDSFVPLGPAARHVLVGEDSVAEGARLLLDR